jgi:probable rRNA maturation factor
LAVLFFTEDISYNLKNKRILKSWINQVILDNGFIRGDINYIFTSNNNILTVNQKFLNHNYFTDIITFNYNVDNVINSDIYISLDTVKENSVLYNVTFDNELCRVMIHGILHLLGYNDSTEKEKAIMRNLEDKNLELLYSKFL